MLQIFIFYLLPFILSWSYLITSCDWPHDWTCDLVIWHPWCIPSSSWHAFYMCSTCVYLTLYSLLLSSMIDMCLPHVAAQHMLTFHLPHVLHALTICLPGCCLEDISIYSLPLYTCNLTSHCCLYTNVTWYSLELFFLLNLTLGTTV